MNTSFFLPDPEEKGAAKLTSNLDIMVDLETMGLAPDSPILTIGAVLFDPFMSDTPQALFDRAMLVRVDVESSLEWCPAVDGGTLKWWLTQDPRAIAELVHEDAVPLKVALATYARYATGRFPKTDDEFFSGHSQLPLASRFWAKSPDFDGKILEHAFTVTKEINPFSFWQYRCVRTVQDMAWPNGPGDRPEFDESFGVLHDARADAVNQALTVQAAYQALKIGGHGGVTFDTF